jgi:hypothetical protein
LQAGGVLRILFRLPSARAAATVRAHPNDLNPEALMRPSYRALFVLALLSLASLALAAPAKPPTKTSAAKELLQNGGFERAVSESHWLAAGWDTSIADLPTPVYFGRDTFLAHSGEYAVSVANTSNAFPMGHNWSQTILVGPETWGKMARFKVWARNNGVEGRAYILVQAYSDTASRMGKIWNVDHDEALKRLGINKIDDPLLDLGWDRTMFAEPLTDWVQREAVAFVAPGTNVLFVRCGLMGTGQVLFDDASLTLTPAPAFPKPAVGKNLFIDPGFEQGGVTWDLAIPPFEGSKVVMDSTVAHTGKWSVRFQEFWDGLVESRIGVGQSAFGRSLRGQRVRLSGWFKGDSLVGTSLVKIYSHGMKSRVVQSPGAELLSGTWDWKQLSIEMDIPEDSEIVWAHLQTIVPARGVVWIDDASFEVVGPAKSAAKPSGTKPAAAAKPKNP